MFVPAITRDRRMTKPTTPTAAHHPPGLYVLFFTEMWERFGFYLMIGILFLFLRDPVSHGGKGMDNALATDIVGSYLGLVYFTPFIGGFIADRYLGYRRAVLLGGTLFSTGYALLAIPSRGNTLLFLGLGFIIVGNGFFKPNISTLLGNIYNSDDLKARKDAAYNIFYMGINIGAFICNFVAAYQRNHYGWGYAFGAASVGMAIGVGVFLGGMRHVRHGDVMKPPHPGDLPFSRIMLYVFVPALIAGAIGWFVPELVLHRTLLDSNSNDAFVFACVPVVGFFVSLWVRAEGFDKRRIGSLLIMFGVSILFWNIYNQNATALTIWADSYTHREMPRGTERFLKTFDLAQTINTQPKDVPILDEHFRTELGPDGKVSTHQGLDPYFQNLKQSRWPAQGEDLKLISTEIYQSVNPFWIIMLTPVVVGFFGWLRARGREPSTPSKIAWGVVISGVSSLVMVSACLSTDIYHDKVSSAWIVTSYGVFTISELFLSPIGLSLTSKVAPRRIMSLMMGGWFLTTSLGGKLSAILARYWDSFDSKWIFFGISAVAAIVAGLALLPLTKRLAVVVDEASSASE
jgi:POT family proton-dependent oligopeptide transporter